MALASASRACSNAGMKVVIGYRNEERLKAALPLFKPGNAGVLAIKHDVTDRDGWAKLLAEINEKFGNLHLVVNNARHQDASVRRARPSTTNGITRSP